jgi:hypothetical protein
VCVCVCTTLDLSREGWTHRLAICSSHYSLFITDQQYGVQAAAAGFDRLQYRDHNQGAQGKLSVFSILHLGAPSLGSSASIAAEAARVQGGPGSSYHEEFFGRAYGLGYVHAVDPESSCRNLNSVLELCERFISPPFACVSGCCHHISPSPLQASCPLLGRNGPTEAIHPFPDGQFARPR